MNDQRRTIVGGRSRSNRLVGDFPRGIEILLKKASVDPVFSQYLLQNPLNAARSIALDLKLVEINILNNTSKPILEKMIASTHVPKQHIKTFRTARTAAVLALVLSSIVVIPELAAAGQPELPEQGPEQEELAQARMEVVQGALEAYRDDHGTYPSTKAWFDLPSPLSEYAPHNDFYDPWRRRFHYNAVKEGGKIVNYKLESLGLDIEVPDDNIPCPVAVDEHRFTGICSLKILFPVEGQTITIDNHQDKSEKVLQIRAEHENEKVLVYWYLNEVNIGTTLKEHNLIVDPVVGKNTLLLIDENEESADIVFSAVKEEEGR